MEQSPKFFKEKLGNYNIIKKLGQGATSEVYLVQNEKKEQFAAKIMRGNKLKRKQEQVLQTEMNCLLELKQENIIRGIEVKFYGELAGFLGEEKVVSVEVMYIVLEYCSGFDFYDYLYQGPFEDGITLFYILQIANAVNYMHKSFIVHRDLKLDNILLDEQCDAKIADFGYAKLLLNDPQILKTYCGTKNYMAPEIINYSTGGKLKYSGNKVDVFSLGVMIFIMKCFNLPFRQAILNDPRYNLFVNNNAQFWKINIKKLQQVSFSDQFIDLINKMLEYDPERRISMEEVLAHPWLTQNEVASKEVVTNEIQRRQQQIRQEKLKPEIVQQNTQQQVRKYKSSGGCYYTNEEKFLVLLKESMNIFKYYQMLTTVDPDIITGTLVKAFQGFTQKNIEVADQFYRFQVREIETQQDPLSLIVDIFGFEFDVSDPKAESSKSVQGEEEQEMQFFLIDFILIEGDQLDLNEFMKVFLERQDVKELTDKSISQVEL